MDSHSTKETSHAKTRKSRKSSPWPRPSLRVGLMVGWRLSSIVLNWGLRTPEPGLWWGGLRFEVLGNLVVSKAAIMTKTNVFFSFLQVQLKNLNSALKLETFRLASLYDRGGKSRHSQNSHNNESYVSANAQGKKNLNWKNNRKWSSSFFLPVRDLADSVLKKSMFKNIVEGKKRLRRKCTYRVARACLQCLHLVPCLLRRMTIPLAQPANSKDWATAKETLRVDHERKK